MRERVEDGDEAVDAVEGKRGNGCDVPNGEEGGLDEVEEEECDAGVGEGQSTVRSRRGGGLIGKGFVGRLKLGRDVGRGRRERFWGEDW